MRTWLGTFRLAGLAAVLVAAVAGAAPIVITDPDSRVLGDPLVPRPRNTPCVVTLFSNVLLTEDNRWTQPYAYSPPAGCTGPWAKVILVADYTYDPELSTDASAAGIWLNGVNLHFGGHPFRREPTLRPGHVERDVTDYTALLRHGGNGHVVLDSSITVPRISVAAVRASARLLVYPATAKLPPPRKPDAVYALQALDGGPADALVRVFPDANRIATSAITFPRNVERAYLDVLAFGAPDWVWWSCIPDADADLPLIFHDEASRFPGRLGDCSGGTFREAEVAVDGQPAGVAPIVPWISSNTVFDFALSPWPPHEMNVVPYRVDLTPFAGLLSDGAPHTVGVTFIRHGANPNEVAFRATATLFVYRDPHSRQVSGAITRNTLAGQAAVPTVQDTLQNSGQNTGGRVLTTLRRHFVIDGYIDTARGRISSRVVQTVYFSTDQRVDNFRSDSAGRYQEELWFTSKVWRDSYSSLGATQLRHDSDLVSFPIHAFYRDAYQVQNMQLAVQTDAALHQGLELHGTYERSNIAPFRTATVVAYDTTRSYARDFNGDVLVSDAAGTRNWDYRDNRGSCYSVDQATSFDVAGILVDAGSDCPNGVNTLRLFSHPDGSPDSLGWAGYQ